MQIMIQLPLNDSQQQQIQALSSRIELVPALNHPQQLHHIEATEVILGGITPELFARAKKLKWVQSPGAGVDSLLFPEFVASEVILTSMKGWVGSHLAEQAFANLLALTRGVARSIREQTWDNKWSIRKAAWELTEKTMGCVGFGGTGREVARRALAFGMRVIAVDPEEIEEPAGIKAVWKMDRFYDLLAAADLVCICAPLTPATRGLFNLQTFRRMQSHAILVNVTRGAIVVEADLLTALRDGLIGGAALDVTPTEPLPPGHPLWSMPNVVITPHVAGASEYRLDRTVLVFCENLSRFLQGQPLHYVIDKQKGY